MLRPFSYSFGSFPKNGSSPSSSSTRSVPLHHPHPTHEPAIEAIDPSPEESQEAISRMGKFPEVEFNFGHFDWSRSSTFKYVLIEVSSHVVRERKLLVRGLVSAEYHADIAEPVLRQIDAVGLHHDVLGGGRIRYVAGAKSRLTVYGYSMGYPWPRGEFKNELVSQIIQRSFPNISVDWTNEGY